MKPKTVIYSEYTSISIIAAIALYNINTTYIILLTLIYILGIIIIQKELENLENETRKTSTENLL